VYVFKNIFFVLPTKICFFKSCGSSPVSLRSGPDLIKGQLKGDFWWIRVAMGQVFSWHFIVPLSVLFRLCSLLIFHSSTTDSESQQLRASVNETLLSPSVDARVDHAETLWYRFKLNWLLRQFYDIQNLVFARENFCKENSSVIQSVRERLVSSFTRRVIWRCVEEL